MKKSYNKGFMLVETLIASTFLTTILIILFVQFNSVSSSYDSTFKYNTVNGMYAANNIRLYMLADMKSQMRTDINNNSIGYVDISDCSTTYINKINYCQRLFSNLRIEQVIITKDNLDIFKTKMGNNISQEMKDFVNILGTENDANALRLIIQYQDNTYASIKMVGGA